MGAAAMVFALTACRSTETKETQNPSTAGTVSRTEEAAKDTEAKADDSLAETVYGKVDTLDGNEITIFTGTLAGKSAGYKDGDPGVFLKDGQQERITVTADTKIVESAGTGEKERDIYSIGEGSILKIQYENDSVASVLILNDELAEFIRQIQTVFAEKDGAALAEMVSYPCYVVTASNTSGQDIGKKEELEKMKDEIFSDQLVKRVEAYDPSSVSPDNPIITIGDESGRPSVEFSIYPGGKLKINGITAIK